jgi:hypothetical protein
LGREAVCPARVFAQDPIVSSYRCSILPRVGRWRADIPGAFSILFAIAFATGVVSEDIRTEPTLRWFVWGSLAGAALMFVLARRGWYTLRYVLTIVDRRVTLTRANGTVIDLGVPASIDHGRLDLVLSAGKMARRTPHLWISITSRPGRVLRLQRAMGIADHVPRDWPTATPPQTREIFSSVSFDPVSALEALTRC